MHINRKKIKLSTILITTKNADSLLLPSTLRFQFLGINFFKNHSLEKLGMVHESTREISTDLDKKSHLISRPYSE
jgi:hypothetical protein